YSSPESFSFPDAIDVEPEATIDGEEVDGTEGSCGDPQADEPAPRQHPARLTECCDELELRSWCDEHGPAVVRAGHGTLERLLAHAETVGVSRDTVRAWLGLTEAA